MAKTLEEMRAELNGEGALDYFSNLLAPVKAAYTHMPGAPIAQAALASASDMFGNTLGNLYGVGKQIATGRLNGTPEGTAYAYEQAQKLANKMHYTPPTQAGRDIYEGINKLPQVVTGSHMGVGPLPEIWNNAPRVTPDDVRVIGKTAIEDVRNFSNDYANARAGLTRDYPTLGSTAANVVQKSEPVVEHVVKPLAEKAYERYINPWDRSETSASPIANISGLFDSGRPMFAVKPKGGNNPTNLGSTLPLSEQGALGDYLSKVQYTDPMAVFEAQLKKHYPRNIDNRQLLADFEDYQLKRLGLALDPNSPERFLSNEQLRKKIADEFAEGYNAGTIGAADIEPTDKKLHTASQIEQALPHYNSWIMGQHKKYITNQMGTGLATDPALQAVNESGMPPHVIFGLDAPRDWEVEGLAKNAAIRREDFINSIYGYADSPEKTAALENSPIGRITATTPEGMAYENALDASLYPKGPYSFKGELDGNPKFPVVNKLDRNTLITDFLTEPNEDTGFAAIRKKVFQDILSGTLDPADLPKTTMDAVIRQMIKDKTAEFKEAQLSKKGAAEWIPKRAAEMPTDMEFPDGSKMTIITPEMANADELMTARDLGQITIDLNQCVGAGCHATQDYPGHGPYVVPHTGKPPRGKAEYDKYGYLRRLKNGDIEIGSLKDPQGVSQATLELKLEKPSLRAKEAAIIDWFKKHNMLDAKSEFTDNVINFGLEEAVRNAFQLYEALKNDVLSSNQKSILQIKGHSNNEVKPEYVPQMVEWLNANADNLIDVRELNNLPGVHDLTRSYDAIGKMMDAHPAWYSPTVEEFFKKVEDENLLPRFFTTDKFEQLAHLSDVDLSAEPIDVNATVTPEGKLTEAEKKRRQEAYERVSQELRNTFTDTYLRDAFNRRDNSALRGIVQELEERPFAYGLVDNSPGTRQAVINRLRNRGLHTPPHELENIAQDFEPEPDLTPIQQFNRPTEFERNVVQDAMNDFFNRHEGNMPDDMAEPHATNMRILLGNQSEEAKLPIGVHRRLVEGLLDQDVHNADIRDLIDRFQRNNHFLTEAQAENMLNILISWTERYPLRD